MYGQLNRVSTDAAGDVVLKITVTKENCDPNIIEMIGESVQILVLNPSEEEGNENESRVN